MSEEGAAKKRKYEPTAADDRDHIIKRLSSELVRMRKFIKVHSDVTLYASEKAVTETPEVMPESGCPATFALEAIKNEQELDFRPRLNTSSYVNVVSEPEEKQVALLGLSVNIADQTIYPQSFKMHNDALNMIAHLWHCPKNEAEFNEAGCFAGAGTVGSTEACLLAGLALKFRWRKWYAAKNNLTEAEVRGVYPNLVISDLFQACWEKLFRYLDIEPRFIQPSYKTSTITGEQVKPLVDDKTIGVVCIMGNHYGGQYDPVWEVAEVLEKLNQANGWQVGIHVDAASGGFIAPFQPTLPAWDFRLPQVLSISSSGHKFGESCCGTGWVVWRQRAGLSEHIAISVSYLGGNADSYTLNFSRPASGPFVQLYKFLRLGRRGYQALCDNMMSNAKYLRDGLKTIKKDGVNYFVFLDNGDTECLPVVTAYFNPDLNLPFDCIDLQHALSTSHWYVSGYKMSYNHPLTEESMPLFCDADKETTMFRVVVKSNVTRDMMKHLLNIIRETMVTMETMGGGYALLHGKTKALKTKHHSAC